jgi:hypothetical protein
MAISVFSRQGLRRVIFTRGGRYRQGRPDRMPV